MAGETQTNVALVVGGGPGISASCARLLSSKEYQVAIAARSPDKPVLSDLHQQGLAHIYECDASRAEEVASLFDTVESELGTPSLVIHNIDGRFKEIFREPFTSAPPELVNRVVQNSALSAFYVAQQAAKLMLKRPVCESGRRGTMIFTNASAALKGYPMSAAFAMACHAKRGLAESMARELMPEGIHVAHVPIDAAIGWTQPDGDRAHSLRGKSEDDDLADPDQIAETYLQIHQQHRSTWAFEIVLRPWSEKW